MYEIKYGISLNEYGRPCIELPDDYEQKPEDKFFTLEIARYFLQMTHSRMTPEVYDQNSIDTMDVAIRLLGQVGDEMAHILHDGMRTSGEVSMMMAGNACHINVESIEERDALPATNIFFGDKLFDRVEGLKVGIVTEEDKVTGRPYLINEIYELVDGVTNEHWVKK